MLLVIPILIVKPAGKPAGLFGIDLQLVRTN